MSLTSETKLFIGVFGFTALLIVIALVIFSRPPKPLAREELIPSDSQATGSAQAGTWLVEFSDFQCPACKVFSGEVANLINKYPDKLLVVYRHFPLPQHPESRNAAMAAEAAGVQGKFWEMEKLLFNSQSELSSDKYASLAAALNLDTNLFARSLTDRKLADKIQADVDYGNRIGIDSTPTFYLNGIKLSLGNPSDLAREVEKAINQ
jgi:protein-disulfide isomerase